MFHREHSWPIWLASGERHPVRAGRNIGKTVRFELAGKTKHDEAAIKEMMKL